MGRVSGDPPFDIGLNIDVRPTPDEDMVIDTSDGCDLVRGG